MAINSKKKGNSFERLISNKLSERFKIHTKLEQSFRRNSDSGSYFGGSNISRCGTHDLSNATFGDIITPDNFKFVIECKSYSSPLSLKNIMKQSDPKIDSWIKQVSQDSEVSGLCPVIIVKYNNHPIYVISKDKSDCLIKYKEWGFMDFDMWLNKDTSYFFKGIK